MWLTPSNLIQKWSIFSVYQWFKMLIFLKPPALSNFLRGGRKRVLYYNCSKITCFSVWTTFKELLRSFKRALAEGYSPEYLLIQECTSAYIARECWECLKKGEWAAFDSLKFMSFIIDEADQSAFGLFHFTTESKDIGGHPLNGRPIGGSSMEIQSDSRFFQWPDSIRPV